MSTALCVAEATHGDAWIENVCLNIDKFLQCRQIFRQQTFSGFTFKNWMQNRSMLAICLQTYSNI